MITLRRAQQRQHERCLEHEVWRTFYPQEPAGDLGAGFGDLNGLDERLGRSYLMHAGEFQRMNVGDSRYPAEVIASAVDPGRVFQICVHVCRVALGSARARTTHRA